MKKLIITGAMLLAVLLVGPQASFAYQNVTSSPDGGCLKCHSFAGGSGAQHSSHTSAPRSLACSSCHAGGTAGKNVTTAKCIACHPTGGPGKCQLINLGIHPKSGTQSCLSCHSTCASTTTTVPGGTTTTTVPPGTCIDNDNDSYGDNCNAGPDCDDTDNTTYEGCAIDCTLTIRPKTFTVLRAVLSPIQFFTIRADRNSSISFANPICIFWESEGIDDVVKMRLGEKLIIGYVRVYPTHLTAGNFNVQVTFGDISETQCGPIEVK